jgi:hypothetical protein
MAGFTTIEECVEYGLDQVDEERVVEVPLRDLLFVHKTLGELIRFFQNPSHYPDLDTVHDFVGNTEEGALRVLWDAHHEKLSEAFPTDVASAVESGDFDHPEATDYGVSLDDADDTDDEFDDDVDDDIGMGFDDEDEDGPPDGLFDDFDLDDR